MAHSSRRKQFARKAGRWEVWPLPIASSPLLARLSAGSISTPPVDTLGLAVGRRCGFGREGVSGYDPCLLEVALPGVDGGALEGLS